MGGTLPSYGQLDQEHDHQPMDWGAPCFHTKPSRMVWRLFANQHGVFYSRKRGNKSFIIPLTIYTLFYLNPQPFEARPNRVPQFLPSSKGSLLQTTQSVYHITLSDKSSNSQNPKFGTGGIEQVGPKIWDSHRHSVFLIKYTRCRPSLSSWFTIFYNYH